MSSTLPISRLVSVSINLSPLAAQSQNLSSLLILGTSAVIDTNQRMRAYTSLSAVAADFGTSSEEYLTAELWFAQTPTPTGTLYIGRWCKAAASGSLVGAVLSAAQQLASVFNTIANGGINITVDGGAPQNITGINLASPAISNLNAVASAINAHLTGATVVWDAANGVFRVISNSTGIASTVSFAGTLTGGGTDLAPLMGLKQVQGNGAYQAPGVAAETALAALTLLDGNFGQQWYAVQIPSAADGDHLVCAAYCEASSTAHFYAVTTEEAGVVVASSTTDIAAELAALGLNKTAVQYCSSSPYAFASAIARILAVDYTGKNTTLTLMWKQEPGVVPESLTASQIASLEAKNCNVFVNYNNGTAIFEPGKCVSGEFIDTIMGIDAFKVTLQTALYNVLYTLGTKAPQTDDGVHLLVAAAEKVCTQFVNNGLFAPGTWNYAGFGALLQGAYLDKGYYVYAAPVASQSSADRAARKSPTIQIAVLMAGAIHTVALSVQVSN